jgi:hypothetical protein
MTEIETIIENKKPLKQNFVYFKVLRGVGKVVALSQLSKLTTLPGLLMQESLLAFVAQLLFHTIREPV